MIGFLLLLLVLLAAGYVVAVLATRFGWPLWAAIVLSFLTGWLIWAVAHR